MKKNFPGFFDLQSLRPRFFEIFHRPEQGKAYGPRDFTKDLLAGFVVGIVALPLSMAFSISAGGSPVQGIYTAIAAGFFVSLLGGSKFQIAGPTGAFVVIIFNVAAKHGIEGLIAAGLIAGLILVGMGLSGLGKFITYIPYPVTTGFTAGIGVLIFSQQIKDFLGLSIDSVSPGFVAKWADHFRYIETFNPAAMGVGIGTIVIIILLRRLAPRVPAAALAVTAATLVCHFFKLETLPRWPVETIGARFGLIPSSLPIPAFPRLSWGLVQAVFPDAFTIAMLAAIESLLSAVVADSMTGDRHNANMELAAQGIGNIASAFFGGIPATGAIARTAANIKNGAVSPVAGIIHSLTLLGFILFLAPAASTIPLASLAGVLIVVAWDMSGAGRFIRLVKTSLKSDAAVLLVTFVLTVAFDLTFAVEVGVIMAVFLFLRRMVAVSAIKLENTDLMTDLAYGEIKEDTRDKLIALSRQRIEVYEITGPFFFGIADMLQNTIRNFSKTPKVLIIRMRNVPVIDATGITALESLMRQCRTRKITLLITEIQDQPQRALEKTGFISALGRENTIDFFDDAVAAALRESAEGHKSESL
ncbi:MAG: STAS domain-containing protein [Spirochaetaceae bacterium]|jgi:SulP family sulfate permease|nr:STAS domain-containing protein [Spirochaetaceae bacterium]